VGDVNRDPDDWQGVIVVAALCVAALMWWGFMLAKELRQ